MTQRPAEAVGADPDAQAETHARLALGGARGLLFDLLVTGEREEVARAADLLNRLLLLSAEVGGAGGPGAAPGTAPQDSSA